MNRLAQEIRVPANLISAIILGQRSITGETALRLGRYFGTTPAYWINMQACYVLETARDEWESRSIRDPAARCSVSRGATYSRPAWTPVSSAAAS